MGQGTPSGAAVGQDDTIKGLPPIAQPQEELGASDSPISFAQLALEKQPSRDPTALESRRSSRRLSGLFELGGVEESGGVAGLRGLSVADTPALSCLPRATDQSEGLVSKWEHAKITLRDYPVHLLRETILSIPVLTIGLLPVFLFAGLSITMREGFGSQFCGTFHDLEVFGGPYMDTGTKIVSFIYTSHNCFFYYYLFLVVTCALFDWRIVLPLFLRQCAPFMLLQYLGAVVYRVMAFQDKYPFGTARFYINGLILIVGMGSTSFRLGRRVHSPNFGVLFTCGLVLLIVIATGYRIIWSRLILSSDGVKFLFVVFLNPLVYEFVITYMRMAVRSLRSNDPSSGPILVGMAMTFKKMFGRYIAATMKSNTAVAAASAVLGVAEIVFSLSLKMRDRFMYRNLCGNGALASTLAHERNRNLRVQNALLETVLEIAFTWVSIVLMLLVNITDSDDAVADAQKVAPSTGHLVVSGLLQTGIEIVVDLVVVIGLTVFQGENFLWKAERRISYWWFTTGMLAFFGSTYLCVNIIPYILFRDPTQHPAHWIIKSAVVEPVVCQPIATGLACNMNYTQSDKCDILLNMTSLAQQFKEARESY